MFNIHRPKFFKIWQVTGLFLFSYFHLATLSFAQQAQQTASSSIQTTESDIEVVEQKTDPNEKSPKQSPLTKDSLLGWSLSGLAGVNICVPSGKADCSATYPGMNVGLSSEYRWRYFGLLVNLDWGTLTPIEQGSEEVTHRLSHVGLGLRAYYPRQNKKHYFTGFSLGMGQAKVHDDKSDSGVEWFSFWSDLRVDVGGLWYARPSLAIEGQLSANIHLGGTRCVLFRGAGPCSPINDLPTAEQSMAKVLMLRLGVRWIP